MLLGAVVLVLVLTSPPLASSHANGHGVGPPKGRPSRPWTGLPLSRPCRNLCRKLGCTEDEVCVVPHDDSAYCEESDPCWTHHCLKDSPCIVVDGLPTCFSLDCEYDGSVYKHGEDDGCYYTCYIGKMKVMTFNPTTGNQCKEPFKTYYDKCYYHSYKEVTWCEARSICRGHGGDLAANDFNTLHKFYLDNDRNRYAWIGLRSNVWLDGQEPQQQEWRSGEPDEQDQCGWMSDKGIGDNPCDTHRPYICQLY